MAKKTEVRPSTGHINPFGLRMQEQLRARLEAAANAAGRSLNAEIVARLERSFTATVVPADSSGQLKTILAKLDQNRDDLDAARLKVFSQEFSRSLAALRARGLSNEDAVTQAHDLARKIAYPMG